MSEERTLLDAIRAGDLAGVLRYLEAGAAAHWRDENGHGAVFHAVFNRQWAVLDLLLAHGAFIDLASSLGWTPLFWAAFNGHADAVGQLVARGADVDRATDEGDRPLFLAAYKGHAEVVRLLLAGRGGPRRFRRPVHRSAARP